jgi:hypothetical protein
VSATRALFLCRRMLTQSRISCRTPRDGRHRTAWILSFCEIKKGRPEGRPEVMQYEKLEVVPERQGMMRAWVVPMGNLRNQSRFQIRERADTRC